ncbi:MAG: protein-disulfide reductase DsbD [Gammaproteobacteria bacterium]|nr:protein-disulfide reductase DsbD [Gammaproteobacteria bacterium]
MRVVTAFLLALLFAPASTAAAGDWLAGARARLGLSPAPADAFLDPDAAFALSAEADGHDRILTHWIVADGYYLYTEKFRFATAAAGVTPGPVYPPTSAVEEDPYFGRVPIATGEFDIVVPLTGGAAGARTIALQVAYQGCAMDGICYPPITKTLRVALPAGAAAAAPAGPPAAAPGHADAIAARLASGRLFAVLAGFYGFGLLLAFTPCVLPMIPILSGLVIGAGPRLTTRTAFTLSATYVLAMALVYALAGVAAGLFGSNLQAMFQIPQVLAVFAALFVALAASMFDLFPLQLPAALQSRLSALSNRQPAGRLGGVAIMGALSAVIVGPCVAPPLAGALLYIAASGNAVTGGLALFVLALGMGTPLLAIGASAGHWLPRAGAWMETVKRLFGVMLLGVALWLLERILPGPLTLALWGLLLSCSAVFFGAIDASHPLTSGWRRLGRGLALAALVWGAAMLVGASGGASDPLRPLAGLMAGDRGVTAAALEFRRVKGQDGLQAALAQARGRPAMLDFYADWCIECKQLERTTFADARVRKALDGVLLLQADVTAHDADDRALLAGLELFGPPAILFFGADGRERRELRIVGYVAPDAFRAHLATVDAAALARR